MHISWAVNPNASAPVLVRDLLQEQPEVSLTAMRDELMIVTQNHQLNTTELTLTFVTAVDSSGRTLFAHQSVHYGFGRVSWINPRDPLRQPGPDFHPDQESEQEIARLLRAVQWRGCRAITNETVRQLLEEAVNS